MVDPLSDADYARLRRHARTHREDLVVRLCGEAGLRPAEVASLEPSDVGAVDGTTVASVDDHATVLPAGVAHDVEKYAASNDVGDDDRLVDVSARRVQMLVREVADRAASETGDDRFREVDSRSLREHFVVSLLRQGVDVRVVAAVAGFESVAGLVPYLDDPGPAEIAAALDDAAALAVDDDETPEPVRRAAAVLAAVGDALGDQESPAALFETVVDRIASTDGYRYAWVGRRTDDDATADVVANAGVDPAVAAAELRNDRGEGGADDTTQRAEATEGESEGEGEGERGRVRRFDRDRGGVVTLPVGEFEGVAYALGLGVERVPEPDGTVEALHDALGALVARAFEATRRRRRLVADVVTELRFDVHDRDAVLVALADSLDTTVEVTGVVPGGPGLVLYAAVADVAPTDVVDAVDADDADRVVRVRYVDDGDDGPVFEFVVRDSPARTLVDLDARVRSYRVDADGGRLTAVVPADADVRAVRDALRDAWPDSALVGQETVERTIEHARGFADRLRDDLTDRQLAVLQSAYHGGYFQWPRESTGEELADSLDVAAPTLHNHLRVAQRKLLDAFFES
ncbi:bacterio-opsin activator domain-containing protein [Halorubellus sp. PRR65]|uniref:bacterio-opsin activator domain-containing protein n=1 Tax=Halorubellus sp. PRR65 TaxID=3098148 RepID=UPI002B25AC95|nr:bacterio-opsin activator domain-containing protein [Halorubellus sp. PRR65]